MPHSWTRRSASPLPGSGTGRLDQERSGRGDDGDSGVHRASLRHRRCVGLPGVMAAARTQGLEVPGCRWEEGAGRRTSSRRTRRRRTAPVSTSTSTGVRNRLLRALGGGDRGLFGGIFARGAWPSRSPTGPGCRPCSTSRRRWRALGRRGARAAGGRRGDRGGLPRGGLQRRRPSAGRPTARAPRSCRWCARSPRGCPRTPPSTCTAEPPART